MSEETVKIMDAYRCVCPGCGSRLAYDIRSRALRCESCLGTWEISQFPDEGDYKQSKAMETVEYVCPSCGASVHSTQTSATSFCSFCGSEVVLTERLSRMRRPDRILPFRITREECESIYRKKLGSAPFVPKSLLAQETIDHFRPVYIPYWVYSFHADGEVEASGIKKYSDSSYNYTDTYDYRLSCDINVSDMIYDASSAFEDETAQKLNFRLGVGKDGAFSEYRTPAPFHPAYLCGMYTEAPDADPIIYEDSLEPFAKDALNSAATLKTGASVSALMPEQKTTDANLILLPVWLLANRRGSRILYTAINGDSGEIVCDTPVSNTRFAMLTAGLFAGFFALLLLITHMIILRPNLLLCLCAILAVVGFYQIVPAADRILTRRQRDTDPTRAMKLFKPEGTADRSIADSMEMQEMMRPVRGAEKKNLAGMVILFVTAGPFVALLLFTVAAQIFAGGSFSRLLSMLISDRGILAPLILIVCLVFLFRIDYHYPSVSVDPGKQKSGKADTLFLSAMRLLLIAGLVVCIVPLPAVSIWYYALSILTLLLLSAGIIRVFYLHNEYVTRPVPFFGKEAEE